MDLDTAGTNFVLGTVYTVVGGIVGAAFGGALAINIPDHYKNAHALHKKSADVREYAELKAIDFDNLSPVHPLMQKYVTRIEALEKKPQVNQYAHHIKNADDTKMRGAQFGGLAGLLITGTTCYFVLKED